MQLGRREQGKATESKGKGRCRQVWVSETLRLETQLVERCRQSLLQLVCPTVQHLARLCCAASVAAGDPVGSAAAHRLHELSGTFPGRMFCPIDHYIAGAEKELLLQATDFCLLPSRFEPCECVGSVGVVGICHMPIGTGQHHVNIDRCGAVVHDGPGGTGRYQSCSRLALHSRLCKTWHLEAHWHHY